MSNRDDINRLESELEMKKQRLREDASLITETIQEKIEETKEEFSPTHLIHRWAVVLTALSFVAGFSLGFFFRRPREAVEQVGKPTARALLASAGTYAAGSIGKRRRGAPSRQSSG
jgi:hypothetical protein